MKTWQDYGILWFYELSQRIGDRWFRKSLELGLKLSHTHTHTHTHNHTCDYSLSVKSQVFMVLIKLLKMYSAYLLKIKKQNKTKL